MNRERYVRERVTSLFLSFSLFASARVRTQCRTREKEDVRRVLCASIEKNGKNEN